MTVNLRSNQSQNPLPLQASQLELGRPLLVVMVIGEAITDTVTAGGRGGWQAEAVVVVLVVI